MGGSGGWYGGAGAGGSNGNYGGNGQQGLIVITYTPAPPTCSITVDQNPITAGNSTTLRWSSLYASSFYITNVGWVAASGATTIAPNTTTSYAGTVSNVSGSGTCGTTLTVNPACASGYGTACTSAPNACGQTNTGIIQCNGQCSATKPPNSSCGTPACAVTFDQNPAPYGIGTTMRWTSQRAASFSIQNVGAVTPNVAGSTHVAPTVATNYSGSGIGHNGNSFSCPATLNISPPPTPAATITSSRGATVTIGQSSTITATFAAGQGDTLIEDNIDGDANNPAGWRGGLGATTNPDAQKSITFTPTTPGTYTFLARMRTSFFPSWATYAEVRVTVPPLPTCSVTFDANPITRGQSTAVRWSSNNATSFTLATIGPVTPNQSGSATVSPQSTTNYSGSASGAGGSVACPAILTVQCAPSTTYSCAGQTIRRTVTAPSCDTTTTHVTTCVPPSFCTDGSAECTLPPAPIGTLPGDLFLQVVPSIVRAGETTSVEWGVDNVKQNGCTIRADMNADHWQGPHGGTTFSGSETSRPILSQTVYTLTCEGLDDSTVSTTAVVNIVPEFEEQ